MATLTYADQPISQASITRRMYGAWVADLALTTDMVPSGKNALKVGSLTLQGTVRRAAAYGGQTKGRVVGGSDGYRKVLGPKGYSHVAGVKLSDVLKDVAAETGELVNVATDRFLGVHYVRSKNRARHVLKLLTGGIWWVDDAGVTQLSERSSSEIKSAFTVSSRSADNGRFEIATEAFHDWTPGRTFSAPNAPGPHTISSVTIRANGTSVRLEVLAADAERERLLADFRAIVREELAHIDYLGVWEYKVASGTSAALELVSDDPRMPNLSKVPSIPGLMGEEVTPAPGSKCYVAFANADPTRPKCLGIEGDPLLVKLNTLSFVLNNGVRPHARLGDLAGAIWPIVATGADFLGV